MACVTLVVEVRKQYVISETDNSLQGSLLLEIAGSPATSSSSCISSSRGEWPQVGAKVLVEMSTRIVRHAVYTYQALESSAGSRCEPPDDESSIHGK